MLTQEQVRRLFHYDESTGVVVRRITTSARSKAGMVVGFVYDKNGHLAVCIDWKAYYLHRVIWLYMTGVWPKADIDHRDGNPGNNRWSNLREATRSQNRMNTRLGTRNTSGVKGVFYDKARGQWAAEIKAGRIRRRLGRFDTLDAAAAARLAAAKELHGEFMRE